MLCLLNRSFLFFFFSRSSLIYCNVENKKERKPRIYLISHRYSFMDTFIASKYARKCQKQLVTIPSAEGRITNKIGMFLYKYTFGFNVNILKRGNTFHKFNNTLRQKKDIAIFLIPNSKKTGIYYLLKNNDAEVVFIDINGNYHLNWVDNWYRVPKNSKDSKFRKIANCIIKNKKLVGKLFGKKYNVSIQKVNLRKYLHHEPKIFIEKMNNHLKL